jgi:hypothetical protein
VKVVADDEAAEAMLTKRWVGVVDVEAGGGPRADRDQGGADGGAAGGDADDGAAGLAPVTKEAAVAGLSECGKAAKEAGGEQETVHGDEMSFGGRVRAAAYTHPITA